MRTTRQEPATVGTRSATSRSKVVIARDRRSSSSRPRPRAASGSRSPIRDHGPAPAVIDPRASPGGPPRAPVSGADLPAVAAATSAGSRSSSVVVVTNACGRLAIRRTRWARRSGSSSEKTSSRRSSGGRPSCSVSRSSSASLNARIAVRCWPREAKPRQVAAAELEHEVVAVRPDQRRPVPDLLLRRLDETAGRASRGDSPGSAGAFVTYPTPSRAAPASSGAISACARASGPARSSRSRSRSATIAPPASRNVPSQNRSSSRDACSSRIERSRLFRCWRVRPYVARSRGVGRRALRRELVDGRPAETRRPGDEEHLLRGEDDGPEQAGEAGRTARDAVDADPLPALPAAPGRTRATSIVSVARRAFDAGQLAAPADELGVGRRPVRPAPGEQDDRLEEARLAGRIRPDDELRPGPEGGLERCVRPQVEDREAVSMDRVRVRLAGVVGSRVAIVVRTSVRSGMTTWT